MNFLYKRFEKVFGRLQPSTNRVLWYVALGAWIVSSVALPLLFASTHSSSGVMKWDADLSLSRDWEVIYSAVIASWIWIAAMLSLLLLYGFYPEKSRDRAFFTALALIILFLIVHGGLYVIKIPGLQWNTLAVPALVIFGLLEFVLTVIGGVLSTPFVAIFAGTIHPTMADVGLIFLFGFFSIVPFSIIHKTGFQEKSARKIGMLFIVYFLFCLIAIIINSILTPLLMPTLST